MKKLLSLFIVLFWLISFWYCADSYTCSYKWIISSVSNKYWIPDTIYLYNCNDLGGIYDCNVYTNVSVSNWNCYQFSWFDLNSYTDINLSFDLGSTYINFSYNNNNLDMLNGYMVCSPARIAIQWRITTYNPNPSFIITEIQESLIYNYSETYTCPTCNTSSLENQLSSCQSDLATATWSLATCQSDLNTCQNSSNCDYSWYILESEVTQNYCEVRYNLIEPSDCPNSSWSWDIQRSSFRVNNFQVMGGRNIYLYIPEWLNRDYTYVDENLQIEVENEGDEEYIQGIIDINSYRPSSEDFTNIFVSGLTLIMPYIVVALFIIFVWKLIKKIFR